MRENERRHRASRKHRGHEPAPCEHCRLFHQANDRKWASPGTALCNPRFIQQHGVGSEMPPVGTSCCTGNRGWEGWGLLILPRAECDYLNSCTWKLLFNFHCDTVIVLGGLRVSVCEELDPWEREAFKPCAWAGLSGCLTETEWGFWLNDHLCLSFSQPGADNRVLWLPLASGRRMHVGLCCFQ